MKLRILFLLAAGLPLALAVSAAAVIIDSSSGTGNVTAPSPDPGWGNVGIENNALSAVYLGNGWVLTANHVGPGDVWFGGVLYPWVPGVSVRLENPDTSLADLVLFKLQTPFPALSALSIRTTPPPIGAQLILIGHGRNRGASTTWNGFNGYLWGPGASKRWGTNFVENVDADLFEPYFDNTQLFGSEFNESHPAHSDEGQAAVGDSGGAAYASTNNGSSYQLAGIMIGIIGYTGQPAESSLYTNSTLAADLSVYRDEINYWMPEPVGGLWAGAALVAALPRPRRRISAPSSRGSARTSDRER